MSSLILDCPHCLGKSYAFKYVAAYEHATIQNRWIAFLACSGCSIGIVAEIERILDSIGEFKKISPGMHSGNFESKSLRTDSQFKVIEIFPKNMAVKAPPETPNDIAKSFVTGSNAVMSGDTVTAAMHFRRALDLSFKELYPDLEGMLAQKIKNLKIDIELPSAMIEWAGELNVVGNGGNHDFGSPEIQDVKDFQMWLELFLEYSFSIPRRLKSYREKKV
ncbi:MAG: DUF4145 domain-containing protein [Pseudomonadota bacterium]